jgi:hypothetical protein
MLSLCLYHSFVSRQFQWHCSRRTQALHITFVN